MEHPDTQPWRSGSLTSPIDCIKETGDFLARPPACPRQSQAEVRAVYRDLRKWSETQPHPVWACAERVLMSLEFCRRNGMSVLAVRELAADVELLRQARFGYR